VTLNSLAIIFFIIEGSITFVTRQISEDTPSIESPLRKFFFNSNFGWFDFIWGLYAGCNTFMLTFLVPAILAMKSRRTYENTMAGSILGVVVALNYLLSK